VELLEEVVEDVDWDGPVLVMKSPWRQNLNLTPTPTTVMNTRTLILMHGGTTFSYIVFLSRTIPPRDRVRYC
jgi:hypothetical protein